MGLTDQALDHFADGCSHSTFFRRLKTEVLARSRLKLGPDHPLTITRMGNLAEIYRQTGRVRESVPLFEETNVLMRARLGPDHPNTLISEGDVANVYQDLGKHEMALQLFQDVLARATAKLGLDHPITLKVMADVADGYLALGHLDEAVEQAKKLSELRRPKDGQPSQDYAAALTLLGRIQVTRKAWAEAEPPLRQSLAIREAQDPNAGKTFVTKWLLGSALLGQKRYAEAEPLLRTGYEGLKARADKLSPFRKHYLSDALDRLISLAEETGKTVEAKAWKVERARLAAEEAPKPPPEKK
jgi:eukaryotic-like serine/threonine-protein kinase